LLDDKLSFEEFTGIVGSGPLPGNCGPGKIEEQSGESGCATQNCVDAPSLAAIRKPAHAPAALGHPHCEKSRARKRRLVSESPRRRFRKGRETDTGRSESAAKRLIRLGAKSGQISEYALIAKEKLLVLQTAA
jgi:hypothetical protein